MSQVTVWDSITAADIPPQAPQVGLYVDGPFAWSAEDLARFAHARTIRIATRASTLDADALDVERGDATPAQAAAWVRKARPQPGRLPLVYCNRGNRADVEAACAGLRYQLWVATLDGVSRMQPGATGTQWAGQTSGSGGHFDLSLFDEAYFGGEEMTTDEQRAFVRLVYIAAGDREPESEQVLEGALADVQQKGAEAFVTDYVDAGEFRDRMAALNQLVADYRAGKLGGGPTPPAPSDPLPKVADALAGAAAQLRG